MRVIEAKTLDLFRTLTELPGAPGFEHAVRSFMKKRLEPISDEFLQDGLGSIFGVKYGEEHGAKIMVAGHMDEVAFMVSGITESGMLRFQPLGGWWSQVLLAQRVQIFTDEKIIEGVIASTPPHLLTPLEQSKPMAIKNMLIDIGADDDNDARNMGIRPGQPIVPVCPFTPLANSKKIMAKAWDNRYGCGLAIELMEMLSKEKLNNTLYVGANVQEEVGLRGAATSTHLIHPDLFIALDASPANDMTGKKLEFGKLGEGVLLRILDRTMITNPKLRDYVLDICQTHKIPYQYFVSPGGTDAGRAHLMYSGIPSIVIGICARYIHTPASIIHTDDYLAARKLLQILVTNIDYDMIQGFSKL